jgi:hypothetical protein
MRRAFKDAVVAGRPSASCRTLTSYGPARAQVQAVNSQQQLPEPSLQISQHSDLVLREDGSSQRHRSEQLPEALSRTYFDSTGVRWVGIGGEEPSDPNKANLGKSELPIFPNAHIRSANLRQPSASSKNVFQPFSNRPSPNICLPQTSPSTSSPQRILTSPPSPAASPTPLPSGPPLSHGTASPLSATSSSRSLPSA